MNLPRNVSDKEGRHVAGKRTITGEELHRIGLELKVNEEMKIYIS